MELPFSTFRPLESVVVLCAPAGATARSFERSLECRREPVRSRCAVCMGCVAPVSARARRV
eukprot:scaffold12184_cov114-Isochrysis_galbana.AAC.2